MPSIADQVATIEHDLHNALARVDALTAENEAFRLANSAMSDENATLMKKLSDQQHYIDDTRTMAESLATSALDMLRSSRRQLGVVTGKPVLVVDKTGPLLVGDTTVLAVVPSDSGDEQPSEGAFEAMQADARERAAADRRTELDMPLHGITITDAEGRPVDKTPAGAEVSVSIDAREIIDLASKLPPNNFGEPVRVEHGKDASGEPVPMFLKPGTPFDSAAKAQVFG